MSKICREGYIAFCKMPNGEEKMTKTFARCDKEVLRKELEYMKWCGTILSYDLKWRKIWVDVEPAIIVQE